MSTLQSRIDSRNRMMLVMSMGADLPDIDAMAEATFTEPDPDLSSYTCTIGEAISALWDDAARVSPEWHSDMAVVAAFDASRSAIRGGHRDDMLARFDAFASDDGWPHHTDRFEQLLPGYPEQTIGAVSPFLSLGEVALYLDC